MRQQAGFTYLGLLAAIVVLGVTMAAAGTVWKTQSLREREKELLFVGGQFRDAIGRYRIANGAFPRTLADLVTDTRLPTPRRHLRRIYADPMNGGTEWELLRAPDGGIMGVASLSRGKPLKQANFGADDSAFKDADCYCAWRFVYQGKSLGRSRDLAPTDSNVRSSGSNAP